VLEGKAGGEAEGCDGAQQECSLLGRFLQGYRPDAREATRERVNVARRPLRLSDYEIGWRPDRTVRHRFSN
jgi:hypothetical protein